MNDYEAKLDANAIENGVLPSEVEWNFESPNLHKSEEIFLYGINSDENLIVIRFKRRPTVDGKCLLKANLLYKEGDEMYELEDSDVINKHHSDAYRLHGLNIQILSPFRKIRITYRGILRKKSTSSKQWSEVFVKINLFWSPLSKAFDFKYDNKASFIAVDVTLNDFDVSTAFEDRYEQYGQLKGAIQIESNPMKNLFLWGNKCKKFCDEIENSNKTWKRMFAYSKEGLAFHFGVCVDNQNKKGFRYGHCLTGFLTPFPIINTSLSLNESIKINQMQEFQITSKDERNLNVKLEGSSMKLTNWCEMKRCWINKIDGSCVFIEEYSDERLDKIMPPFFTKIVLLESKPNCDHLVVPIDKYYCREVYGPKATSLSQLVYVSQEIAENMEIPYFDIPKGVIVTTNAYRLFIEENPDIAEIISHFESKIWNKTYENVKNGCDVTTKIISEIKLSTETKNEIKLNMQQIFGNDLSWKKFSVRSSSLTEDCDDVSGAGINATYLGVKGLDSIYEAVVKCYSSQFAYQAIEYKVNFAQLLHTPMAVIIQEMIDCDTSGILFTCSLVSGDPRRMIISANYGLCESVLCAKSEPDRITMFSTVDAAPKIECINIGSKKFSVTLSDPFTQGTVTFATDGEERSRCCVEEEMLLQISILAAFLRRTLGYEADIEWGIKNNGIYVFQSRPITNLQIYSKWEIFHEMDTAAFTERSVLSRERTCESFPSAMSYLGLSFINAVHNTSWMITLNAISNKLCEQVSCPYISLSSACVSNQLFLDMKNFMMFNIGDETSKRAYNIAHFGHDIEDEDILNYCSRGAQTETSMLKNFFANVSCSVIAVTAGPIFHRTQQKYKRFDFNGAEAFNTSKNLFEFILNSMSTIYEVKKSDTYCSNAKTAASIALVSTLLRADELPLNVQLYHDISLLLTNNTEVISSNISRMLREVAVLIENRAKFRDLSDEEAFIYLKHNEPMAKKSLHKFLKTYGHRGHNEFDLYCEPWEQNATQIIKLLRKLIDEKSITFHKMQRTTDEVIAELQSNLTQNQKFLLKQMLIPLALKSIKFREKSKSFLISTLNEYRKVFKKLSEVMENEGRLPEKQLIYFLTIEEIFSLLQKRDSSLISKAKHRRKLFPTLCSYQFDNTIKGPDFQAKNVKGSCKFASCVKSSKCEKVCGTPVCIGKVSGRAVVVNTFQEIDYIQRGDILITNSVDVAWTPYFGLLSAVVTEIDCLLSHGCIIVREYGLPCIVGAKNATQIFKTGDHVMLDSQYGVLLKVQH